MLNCVYHPTDEMRVVEDDEKARLLATGVWFDHPTKAIEMRKKMEDEVKKERRAKKVKSEETTNG